MSIVQPARAGRRRRQIGSLLLAVSASGIAALLVSGVLPPLEPAASAYATLDEEVWLAPNRSALERRMRVIRSAGGPTRAVAGRVRRGRSFLKHALERGLRAADLASCELGLRDAANLRHLEADAVYVAQVERQGSRLAYLHLELEDGRVFEVTRDAMGRLRGQAAAPGLMSIEEALGFERRGSFAESLAAAGEGPELGKLLEDALSWKLRDDPGLRDGDRFRVVVEKRYRDGVFEGYGRLVAAEYAGRLGRLRAFYFDPRGGEDGAYYGQNGSLLSRHGVGRPLAEKSVSSGYQARRFHPILGFSRAHLGVDYAAPRGTPVRAVEAGLVVSAGRAGGSGLMVSLEHPRDLTTLYAHLNSIAPGIRPGATVAAGQLIGTVGSTGLATGPHLHFAVQRGGRFVDPRTLVTAGRGDLLDGERPIFEEERERALERLNRTRIGAAAEASRTGAGPAPGAG